MKTIEETTRIQELTLKFFRTPASKMSASFTQEEVNILKEAGIIHKPYGKKMSLENAEVTARAYTKLA